MISPSEALQRLKEGNRRFVAGEVDEDSIANRAHKPGAAAGQSPFAIVLACSDSRVPIELVFDQGIGDLFVIRVAGNIVAPSQIGSIEFAAAKFGTRLVLVLGHSNCGAVIATLEELALNESHRSPNLRAIVDRVRPAVESLIDDHASVADAGFLERAIQANVHRSVEQLQHGSTIIEELIDAGKLQIVGAEYSIENGTVEFLQSP